MKNKYTKTDYVPSFKEKHEDSLGEFLSNIKYSMHTFGHQHDSADNITLIPRVVGDYELIFIIGGTSEIVLDNNRYTCKKGSVILIPPFTRHEIFTSCDDPSNNYYIHFDIKPFSYAKQFVELFTRDGLTVYNINDFESLLGLYKSFEKEINKKQSGYLVYVESLLVQILTIIARENKDYYKNILQQFGDIRQYNLVDQAIILINDNVLNGISVSKLCNILEISQTSLTKAFNQLIGIPPGKYIKLTVLKYIERDLVATELTIKELADKYNISSEYNLSNTFKSVYGKSPDNFRKHLTSL